MVVAEVCGCSMLFCVTHCAMKLAEACKCRHEAGAVPEGGAAKVGCLKQADDNMQHTLAAAKVRDCTIDMQVCRNLPHSIGL